MSDPLEDGLVQGASLTKGQIMFQSLGQWVLVFLTSINVFKMVASDFERERIDPGSGLKNFYFTLFAAALGIILFWGAGCFDHLIFWDHEALMLFLWS